MAAEVQNERFVVLHRTCFKRGPPASAIMFCLRSAPSTHLYTAHPAPKRSEKSKQLRAMGQFTLRGQNDL
jgi:hypothetical protein